MILISHAKNSFNRGRKVVYHGENRNYLKNTDLFLTGSVADVSNSLEVETLDGTRYWVGHKALDFSLPILFRQNVIANKSSDTYVTVIEELEKRRFTLLAELDKVTSAIETLKGM